MGERLLVIGERQGARGERVNRSAARHPLHDPDGSMRLFREPCFAFFGAPLASDL
jgi:hypothetical protein